MDYSNLIQDSIDIIEEHIFEKLSVSHLADYSFFSKYHYQRLFHAVVGDSVMEYIKKRRLSIAGMELCSEEDTILNIALKYGYGSHESFTRAFKAYHGITPTDCRKYKIFNSFEKIYIKKEMLTMTQNINKLSKNTDVIFSMLNEFIVKSKRVGEFTMSKAVETGLRNFKIIAKETEALARNAELARDGINKLTDGFESNNFFQINRKLQIMKVLDDITYKTEIITFNANLQVARTSSEYKEKLDGIIKEYDELKEITRLNVSKIMGNFDELIKLISVDIKNQILEEMKKIINNISDTYKKADLVLKYIKTEVKKVTSIDSSLLIVMGEVENITLELKEACGQISTNREALQTSIAIDSIKQWINKTENMLILLEEYGFKLNILTFDTQLELARMSENNEIYTVVEKLHNLSDNVYGNEQICYEHLEESKNLASLFSNLYHENRKPYLEKALEDVVFQCKILNFYTKTEVSKFSKAINDEQRKRFDDIIKKTINMNEDGNNIKLELTKIGRLEDNADKDNTECILHDIKVFSEKANEIYEDMHKEGTLMADIGHAVIFLAHEYEKISKNIKSLADFI